MDLVELFVTRNPQHSPFQSFVNKRVIDIYLSVKNRFVSFP